jgi:hypothetical protein
LRDGTPPYNQPPIFTSAADAIGQAVECNLI